MIAVVVASALLAIGMYGVLVRRDLIAILASVEIMIGAPLLLLVSLGGSLNGGASIESLGLLVLVLAAAEAAVGLALLVAVARSARSTRIDALEEVHE